jgi:hypothetical protein
LFADLDAAAPASDHDSRRCHFTSCSRSARKERIEINFGEYLRVGLPVTIATLTLDIAMLSAEL